MKIEIDPTLFEGEPISASIFCRCGAEWRAHTKLTKKGDSLIHTVSEGCPNCGADAVTTRVSHDPEIFTLEG